MALIEYPHKSQYYGGVYLIIKKLVYSLLLGGLVIFWFVFFKPKWIDGRWSEKWQWAAIAIPIVFALASAWYLVKFIFEIISVADKNKVLKEGELVLGGDNIRVSTDEKIDGYGRSRYSEDFLRFRFYEDNPYVAVVMVNYITQYLGHNTVSNIRLLPGNALPLRKLGNKVVFDEKAYRLFHQGKLDISNLKYCGRKADSERYQKEAKEEEQTNQGNYKPIKNKKIKDLSGQIWGFLPILKQKSEEIMEKNTGKQKDPVSFGEEDEKFVDELYNRLYKGGVAKFTDEEKNRVWDLVDAGNEDSTRLKCLGGFFLYLNKMFNGALQAWIPAAEQGNALAFRLLGVMFDEKITLQKNFANKEISAYCYSLGTYLSNGRAVNFNLIRQYYDSVNSQKYNLDKVMKKACSAYAIGLRTYEAIHELSVYPNIDNSNRFLLKIFLVSVKGKYRDELLKEFPTMEEFVDIDARDLARYAMHKEYQDDFDPQEPFTLVKEDIKKITNYQ